MTSIPYDPTLVIGQIVPLVKITNLQKLADIQKPLDDAHERLNNTIETFHSVKGIKIELKQSGAPQSAIDSFQGEMDKLESAIVKAAIKYGETAVKVLNKYEAEANKQQEKTISMSAESPMDYGVSKITDFPLSFDSLEFDVQFVRKETMDQSATAGTYDTQSSSTLQGKDRKTSDAMIMGAGGFSMSDRQKFLDATNAYADDSYNNKQSLTAMAHNTNSVMEQYENHRIEGTVVISAKATHKMASILSPFKLDPVKAIESWNFTFPDDQIKPDPHSMFDTALLKNTPENTKNTLNIISGCSKASSFNGFVHLLNQDITKNNQDTTSSVNQIKASFERDLWWNSSSGGFGMSNSFQNTTKTLNSTAFIDNHANLVCNGILPNIVQGNVGTAVKMMSPDPKQIMDQQAAIAAASGGSKSEGDGATAEEGRRGVGFSELNATHIQNSITALSDSETAANNVIDTNTMMTALEDFINKAMEGGHGVPTNFYIKHITKMDIAKAYVKKFFPNGLITTKDVYAATFGIAPGGEKGGGDEGGGDQ